MGRPEFHNELLAAMPRKAYDALAPTLVPVTLGFGEVLYEPGTPIMQVYFPCDRLVSLLSRSRNHFRRRGRDGRPRRHGRGLARPWIVQSPVQGAGEGAGSRAGA